jgi:hypothetical protein
MQVASLLFVYKSVCIALNFITKFHRIWYENFDIGYPSLILFTFIQMWHKFDEVCWSGDLVEDHIKLNDLSYVFYY